MNTKRQEKVGELLPNDSIRLSPSSIQATVSCRIDIIVIMRQHSNGQKFPAPGFTSSSKNSLRQCIGPLNGRTCPKTSKAWQGQIALPTLLMAGTCSTGRRSASSTVCVYP
ncbi:hypothetical protein MGG_17786 [Pyricularia oryzae 70-15]|uniref:Uncharacterized protein n=3 Tax=Pyricularia oryzae TaxID=318829 RepID=G4NHX2_PYRO7|nr:uncharacterized protein MGG_17786 [Pyricularia oryzae 70-15]EHA47832.1 hypothetical protein MGG_17786 [Pyricularia oryzae 70-15]ELQ40498.1 hypothetical protein OOU_Y34scaffold00432g3 [Pyricularia oryzae Y34]